jgi:low molecular weight protein-tyrosine phosphatase
MARLWQAAPMSGQPQVHSALPSDVHSPSEPLRVLFVCMGNICRSPTAEAVFRALVQQHAPQLPVQIDSAGTHDYHVGRAPDERAQEVARAHGIDMSGLRARLLVREDFARFDRVLAMDARTYRAALALAPPQHRSRLRLFMDYAPQLQVREVPDPYHGGAEDFERVFQLTQQAALGLLQELLAGHPAS